MCYCDILTFVSLLSLKVNTADNLIVQYPVTVLTN